MAILCQVLRCSSRASRHSTLPDVKCRLGTALSSLPSVVCKAASISSAPSEPSVFVCVECERLSVDLIPQCRYCQSQTVQRLPLLSDGSTITCATKIERCLCFPPGSLVGVSLAYVQSTLELLIHWVNALLQMNHRYSQGSALSPHFLIGGELVIWLIVDPVTYHNEHLESPINDFLLYDFSADDPCIPLTSVPTASFLTSLRSTLVLRGHPCVRCHRTCAATAEVVWLPSGPESFAGRLCVHMPSEEPITQLLASRSITRFDSISLPGVVPSSLRRGRPCSLPFRNGPPVLEKAATPPTVLDVTPPVASTASFVHVLSLNCGGASGKIDDVIALLDWLDADIACLQELWDAFAPEELQLPNMTLFCAGPRPRGGGLAILVRCSLLAAPLRPAEEFNVRHVQVVRFSLSPVYALVVGNIHLSPGISFDDWRYSSTGFLAHADEEPSPLLSVWRLQ